MNNNDAVMKKLLVALMATASLFAGIPSAANAAPRQKTNELRRPAVSAVRPSAAAKLNLKRVLKLRQLRAEQMKWHKELINIPLPHGGCFKSEYPTLGWKEVPCVKPPDIPMPPRHGAWADTVGNGNDYSAQVSGQLISVIGSFDSVSTTGEAGYTYQSPTTQVADAYTLQINSNFFSNPPACAGAATPALCQGWQQYVYSSKSGSAAYMQYWLINYGKACPAGWTASGTDCYRNSASAVAVPTIPATSLAQVSLTGSVTSGGNDRLDLADGGTHYVVTSPDSMLQLANYWNTAEFTVVGDCCLYSANFNANSSIAVRATVHNGTTSAPTCVLQGFTGETNNLNLAPTPAVGTQSSPTLISNQTSTIGVPSCATASGTGEIHINTFTPTPQINAPASHLHYDFQAVGEFVLAKAADGFEVQSRLTSGGAINPNTSINHAIAAKLGNSVVIVALDSKGALTVFKNGASVALKNGQKIVLPNDGDVTRHNDTYVLRDMRGNSVQVIAQVYKIPYLDVIVGLGRWPENVQGLLVNAKNNVNAVVARGGMVFPAPFNFATFYKVYGDSWRVSGRQSLFTPVQHELPKLEMSNPVRPFGASNLPKAVYRAAMAHCRRAGVGKMGLDDCILDVSVLGDKRAAMSHVLPQLARPVKRATIFVPEHMFVPKYMLPKRAGG